MKIKHVLLFLILAIIVFAGFQLNGQAKNQTQTQTQEKENRVTLYQAQIDEKGEIAVEVLPLKLSSNENSEFSVTFTTHSIDLNYDIKNLATLSDDTENQYKPISWTGGKGGHHIKGVLTFPKLSQEAFAVILTIPEVDNQDRIFSWELK